MQQPTITAPASLWQNRNFQLFWVGQAISLTGTSLAALALPLLVLRATGSIAQMGAVTALLAVGSVLAGVISGVLVDRLNRRVVMVCCDAFSALLFGIIPFYWGHLGTQVAVFYFLAVPIGFLAVSSTVAATASLPLLVERDQLTQANARYQMSFALAFLVGPLLAGSFIPLVGAPALLGLNSLSFLVSVLSLLLIRLRPVADEVNQPKPRGIMEELLAGVRFLAQDARLRWVVSLRLGAVILMGGAFDLVIFRIRHELQLPDFIVGLVWGVGAIGDIAAGLLTPLLRHRLGFGVSFLGGLALLGGSIVIIGLNAYVGVFLLVGVLLTFGDIVAQITSATVLLETTPTTLQGRVTAAVQTFQYTGTALGAAGSTFLAGQLHSTPPVFVGMGICILLLSGLGVLTPAKARSPERL